MSSFLDGADLRAGRWYRAVLEATPIALIAGVLVGGFFLPEPMQRSLSFEYTDPTLLTAYTAHFIHISPTHLAGNLATFVLVSGAFLHLARRSGSKWLFFGSLLTILSVFPLLLSFLNLAVPRNGITYGFSGLNMALVGVLPIAIHRYAETRRRRSIDTSVLLASFFLSASYIAAVAVPRSDLSVTVSLATAAVGCVFVGSVLADQWRLPNHSVFVSLDSLGRDPSIIFGVGVWIGLLAIGFPEMPADSGSVTNIYVHFLGYALGFMTAYLGHEWGLFGDWSPRKKNRTAIASD